ncbi:DUF1543 domain-containing protein [Sphingobacterium sp. HJSM2_6]|uniref:DUF1543 domain-containing protein n=1 Tax=Sphingobacterium sp. HJSM2_6 TaxID=3366264 RepID=UPI003BD256C8
MDLYMLVLGGKPEGRFTEQHDVYFGIADELKELVPDLYRFWPELEGKMHIDSWRKVQYVANYRIKILPKGTQQQQHTQKLFFVNLGGYKPADMEEYHYKQLVVAKDLAEASKIAKETTFWKHHVSSHIDDKYGIDVDDIYPVEELLYEGIKSKFEIQLVEDPEGVMEDKLEIGYLKISKLLAPA